MNVSREPHDTASDEHEWALQERALDAERRGEPPTGDARVDRYRAVARALREPIVPALPMNFARSVAARARAAAGVDDRVESRAIALLVALLAGAGAVWLGADGGSALAALPATRALGNSWVLALAACLSASYLFSWWGRKFAVT